MLRIVFNLKEYFPYIYLVHEYWYCDEVRGTQKFLFYLIKIRK